MVWDNIWDPNKAIDKGNGLPMEVVGGGSVLLYIHFAYICIKKDPRF